MNDADIIKEAYATALAGLYKNFFQSFVDAENDKVKIKHAEAAFKNGVELARLVRDKALSLL